MSKQLLRDTAFHRFQHPEQDLTEGELKGLWRSGELVRIGHGIYGDVTQWKAMAANDRYRALIIRHWERARTDSAVVSHLSAAALWGLPLPSRLPSKIHLSGYKCHRGRANDAVARHSIAVPETDIVEIDGVLCTSLVRTVVDIALLESEALAVMCADAAVRKCVTESAGRNPDRQVAEKKAAEFILELRRQTARRSGRRGVRQARFVVGFANWLSESPGESLSRLRMHQIGLSAPELQVEVSGLGPMPFRLDFLFRDKRVFGEFDGRSKYAADPDAARRQILAEKEREDAIRAVTGWRCVRWQWKDIVSVGAFEAFAWRSGLL